MESQQVLRVAAGVAIAAGYALASGPARADGVETVAVIDLRAGDADARRPAVAAVTAAVRDHAGIWPVEDGELAAALTGERYEPAAREAADALAGAKAAYGSLDCPTAAAAGERAVTALAAAQAAGAEVTESLVSAYVYVLLCSADDPGRAQTVAARLRALGADPPPGVSAEVWAHTPAVDATSNVFLVPVEIAAEPAGAAVWIDHEPAGTAPLRVHLHEGDHVVAAAAPDGRSASRRLALRGREPRSLSLDLSGAAAPRWAAVRDWVDGWRSGARQPTPHDIHQLLETAGVRVAILITTNLETGQDRAEAWGAPAGRDEKTAVMIGTSAIDGLAELADLVLAATAAWDRGEPAHDPTPVPLPGEGDEEKGKAKPWWVYATIVGAIAIGGAVVLANDLADDTQVIRLRYP